MKNLVKIKITNEDTFRDKVVDVDTTGLIVKV